MNGSLSCLASLAFAVLFVVGCGTDGSSATGPGGSGGNGGAGGTVETPPLDCDPLTPSYCGFPYPNDYWTVADSTTVTGLRLALPEVTMPSNRNGVQTKSGPFNEMDGFSPGIAAMTHFPGATVQGLATPDSIEASLSPDSPTVILNADTGERLAHWVDLDEYVVEAKLRVDAMADRPRFTINRELAELRQEQALMLRPAIRPEDATRYIVAIRNVRDGEGALVAPSPGFSALRDDEPSGDDIIESRRAHFEEIFATLEEAGIARDDLQLAWDFTTASRENNTRAMVHIRDDAFAKYPDGVPYTIELRNEGLREGIQCRLEITFDMPLYMTQGETGGLLNLGDDGLPEQNGTYPYAADDDHSGRRSVGTRGARSGRARSAWCKGRGAGLPRDHGPGEPRGVRHGPQGLLLRRHSHRDRRDPRRRPVGVPQDPGAHAPGLFELPDGDADLVARSRRRAIDGVE